MYSLTAGFGNVECVRLLLFYGADVEARDINGQTPLSLAAKQGHFTDAKGGGRGKKVEISI